SDQNARFGTLVAESPPDAVCGGPERAGALPVGARAELKASVAAAIVRPAMDLTGYELELLRDDGELALYRARQPDGGAPVLALVAGRPGPTSIARLEHEYALAPFLDAGWAAKPLELTAQPGPATLLLEDNGGEPLSRKLGRPPELGRFL